MGAEDSSTYSYPPTLTSLRQQQQQLIGRINKVGVLSPRFDVKKDEYENWVNNVLPSRQVRQTLPTRSYFALPFPSPWSLWKREGLYVCVVVAVLQSVVCTYSPRSFSSPPSVGRAVPRVVPSSK